jgi:hypothetical protein
VLLIRVHTFVILYRTCFPVVDLETDQEFKTNIYKATFKTYFSVKDRRMLEKLLKIGHGIFLTILH